MSFKVGRYDGHIGFGVSALYYKLQYLILVFDFGPWWAEVRFGNAAY